MIKFFAAWLLSLGFLPLFCLHAQEQDGRVPTGRWKIAHQVKEFNVQTFAFSRDSQRVVAIGSKTKGLDGLFAEGTGRIYELESGKLLAQWDTGQTWLHYTAFSPDSRHIVTTSLKKPGLRIWDAKTLKLLASEDEEAIIANWSPDSKRLVCTYQIGGRPDGPVPPGVKLPDPQHVLKVKDASTLKMLGKLEGHKESIEDAQFSPSGEQIVSISYDGTVRVWDAAKCNEVHCLTEHYTRVLHMAYSPDGRFLATGGLRGSVGGLTKFAKNNVILWDAKTYELLHKWDTRWDNNSVRFSQDGGILIAKNRNGSHFFDTKTGKVIWQGQRQTPLYSRYAPDGRHAAAATTGATPEFQIWRLEQERKKAK